MRKEGFAKKLKIALAVLLSVVVLVSASVIYVFAATDEAVEGYYTFKKFNSKVTISAVDTAISGDVVVPSEIDGCDVIAIADNAFENCVNVTSLTVPESVKTIGKGAFKGMTALENITLPFTGRTASATNYTSVFGYVFDYSTEETEGATKQCDGYYYFIPSSIKNITITDDADISSYAFYGMTNVESITVDSAESIGSYAFANCSSLNALPIPPAVKTIGAYAYCDSVKVTDLVLPDTLTSIGNGAFKGQTKLVNVTLPFVGANMNASDYTGAFAYIFGATKDNSGFGLSYGGNDYYYFLPTSIKNVVVTLDTSIPARAFYNCVNFRSVTMNSVKSIGEYAFGGCEKLSEVNFGNQLETVGNYALSGLSKVTEINLPSTLTSIGSYAFGNLSLVTELVVPDSVTSIGNGAFQDMNSLESITLPFVGRNIGSTSSNGSSYGYGVFGWIFGLWGSENKTEQMFYNGSYSNSFTIPQSLRTVTVTKETKLDYGAFYNCSFLTEINIPDTVTSIGAYAFYNCSGLKRFVVPNSVTSLGASSFRDCSELLDIVISENITSISEYSFSGCESLNNVEFPPQTTTVGNYAFRNCKSFTEINLPDTVTSVGNYAFGGCENVESVKFSNTLATIGRYAFSGCSGITELSLPSSLTEIGSYAFGNLSSVTELVVPDSVTYIYEGAFQGMNSLESITLPFVGRNIGSTSSYDSSYGYGVFGWIFGLWGSENKTEQKFYNGSYSNSFTIPQSLRTVTVTKETKLDYGAFYNCSFLTEINIPDTVTSIGDYAFYNCSGLKRFVVPNSVTEINNNAFEGCTGLTSITIPNSVTVIGNNAFYNCTGLTSVVLPDGLKTIGNYAFCNCTGITSITIPESVTAIGSYAFRNCTGLKTLYYNATKCSGSGFSTSHWLSGCTNLETIVLSEDLEKIPAYAFYGCTGLSSVVIPDNVTSIDAYAFGGCTNLVTIDIPASMPTLATSAVDNCPSLVLPKEYEYLFGYITFGSYPQTKVTDQSIITVLNDTGGNTVTYNKKEYVKNGNDWYLKAPIKWRVLSTSDNQILLMSEAVLDAKPYNADGSAKDWDSTSLSAWLNGEFKQTAFTRAEANRLTSGYGISGVSVLTAQDLTNSNYGFKTDPIYDDSARCAVGTAYAIANGAETGYCCWYVRETTTSTTARYVLSSDGCVGSCHGPENVNVVLGIRPAICITPAEKQLYSISFYVDNEFHSSDELEFGANIEFPDDLTKEGYSLTGWYTDMECLDPFTRVRMPEEDISVYAKFEINKYTANFIIDDEVTSTQFTYGSKITVPADPSKIGYTFMGWTPSVPETMPSNDLTFNATWKANVYKVRWLINGIGFSQNVAFVDPVVPPDDPEVDGYVFAGWLPEIPESMPANDLVFTAQWESNSYSVTWLIDGETIINEYEPGEAIVIPDDPTKEGHTFIGWNKEIPTVMPAENLTFNAMFSVNRYTVSWLNTGATMSFKVKYGSMIPIPEDPEREGYTFTGWSPDVPDTMPAENLEFMANWQANVHTVTWIVDGVSTQTTVMCGQEINIPAEPIKEGYSFVGWTPEIPAIMPDEDLTFTALFTVDYGVTLTLENDEPIYSGNNRQVLLTIDPEPAEGVNVSWSSDNENIVVVDNNGMLTAVSCGTTEITADIGNGKKGVIAVTVEHRYTVMTHSATCMDDGWTMYNCSVCHDTYTVINEKATGQHSYEATVFEPTCNKPGCTLNICTRCGRVYKSDETAPLGHNFEDWKLIRSATDDTEGLEQRQCMNADCGYTEDRLISKLDQTTYKATFVADGRVVGVVEFAKGTKEIQEPEVPHRDRYNGRWENYVLSNANITINAVYELINLDSLNGISTEKSASYNEETGIATIDLTAWGNSKTIITESTHKVPLDIVLVVDQSGSMAEKLGGNISKKDALIGAANTVLSSVYDDAITNNVDHRIAVVGFGMGTVSSGKDYPAYLNTEILSTGGAPVQMNKANDSVYASALMPVAVDGYMNSDLQTAIGNIEAKGATAADLGLSMATRIFANNPDENNERQRIVIFMTDGTPTYSSDFSMDVANSAIQNAAQLKETYNATIYSVGVMSNAEASNVKLSGFMSSVSSNCDSEDIYYMNVENTDALSDIFEEIITENITRTSEFDNITLIDTVSSYFTLTTQQETALRESVIETYGISNSDISVLRNSNGTTTIRIDNLHPYEDGDKFKVTVSFEVSANEKIVDPGTYPTNTDDAGIILEGNENYESTFAVPTVTVSQSRKTVIFNLNDMPYEIVSVSSDNAIAAPETDFVGEYVFSGWNIPENSVPGDDLTVYNATYAAEKYTVIWNIDGVRTFEYYMPGDVITVPAVEKNSNNEVFRRWSSDVPNVMPAASLEFTAVFGDHDHQYTATVVNPVSCLENGLVRYTCETCGDSYTSEIAAPGNHTWKAITGPANTDEYATEKFKCEICGCVDIHGFEYKLNGTENGIISEEFNYYDESGLKTQPDDTLEILASIGSYFGGAEDVCVYRIGENGERIPCNSVYANGVSIFKTNHFSTYEFVPVYSCRLTSEHVDKSNDNICDICGIKIKNEYTVRWIVNGETVSQATYFEGDTISVPDAPTNGSLEFIGWSPEIPEKMPANKLDFVAMWETSEHTHEIFVAGAYLPSCTEKGFTGNTYCRICGELLNSGEEIPALGHSYENHESVRNGVHTVTRYCTRCGHTLRTTYNENSFGKRIYLADLIRMVFEKLFDIFSKSLFIKKN